MKRFFECKDEFESIQVFIRKELVKLKLDVMPKGKISAAKDKDETHKKKLKTKEEVNNTTVGKVFGNSLNSVEKVSVTGYGEVPKFLVWAVDRLEGHLSLEGLFRKNGNSTKIKQSKITLNRQEELNETCSPHDVAGLLKDFLKELPTPLLTVDLQDAFVNCLKLQNFDIIFRTRRVLDLCLLLPLEHIATLCYLMNLFFRLASQSSVNKMDAANIATCITPTLCGSDYLANHFKKNIPSSKKKKSREPSPSPAKDTMFDVIELLINNANEIGQVSKTLIEEALLSATVVGAHEPRRTGSKTRTIQDVMSNILKVRDRSSSKNRNSSMVSSDGSAASDKIAIRSSYFAPTQAKDEFLNSQNPSTPLILGKRKIEEESSSTMKSSKRLQLKQQLNLNQVSYTPKLNKESKETGSAAASDFKSPELIRDKSATKRFSMRDFARSFERKDKREQADKDTPIIKERGRSLFTSGKKEQSTEMPLAMEKGISLQAGSDQATGASSVEDKLDSVPVANVAGFRNEDEQSKVHVRTTSRRAEFETRDLKRVIQQRSGDIINRPPLNKNTKDIEVKLNSINTNYGDVMSTPTQAKLPEPYNEALDNLVTLPPSGLRKRLGSEDRMSLRRGQPNAVSNGLKPNTPVRKCSFNNVSQFNDRTWDHASDKIGTVIPFKNLLETSPIYPAHSRFNTADVMKKENVEGATGGEYSSASNLATDDVKRGGTSSQIKKSGDGENIFSDLDRGTGKSFDAADIGFIVSSVLKGFQEVDRVSLTREVVQTEFSQKSAGLDRGSSLSALAESLPSKTSLQGNSVVSLGSFQDFQHLARSKHKMLENEASDETRTNSGADLFSSNPKNTFRKKPHIEVTENVKAMYLRFAAADKVDQTNKRDTPVELTKTCAEEHLTAHEGRTRSTEIKVQDPSSFTGTSSQSTLLLTDGPRKKTSSEAIIPLAENFPVFRFNREESSRIDSIEASNSVSHKEKHIRHYTAIDYSKENVVTHKPPASPFPRKKVLESNSDHTIERMDTAIKTHSQVGSHSSPFIPKTLNSLKTEKRTGDSSSSSSRKTGKLLKRLQQASSPKLITLTSTPPNKTSSKPQKTPPKPEVENKIYDFPDV